MRTTPRLLTVATIAGSATALTVRAYCKAMKAARQRIETGAQIIDSTEFAESGNGPAVLLIHGAGGGFDQGLSLARVFLGENYRLIAPSRFGYLGTPMPEDPSPEAQADAYARLLDALNLESLPVVAVSAGAPSAIQLCLRHPEHCSALVLIVPLAYSPETGLRPNPVRATVLDTMASSDFLFWAAMNIAPTTLVKTILGTPAERVRKATADDRSAIKTVLNEILPISRRVSGIFNDAVLASRLHRYPLEDIHVPTMVISAEDDGYGTFHGSRYTAEQIEGAKFFGFPTGGHLLVGHREEVFALVTSFVKESIEARTAAIAS